MEIGCLSTLMCLVLATLMAGFSGNNRADKAAGKRPAKSPQEKAPAKKAKGKQTPGASSSSQPPQKYDKTRFDSAKAAQLYDKLKTTRKFIPERGINPRHMNDDRLAPLIEHLGWQKLAKHPTENASKELALEAYANMVGCTRCDNVFIRNHRIDFSADAINRHFGFPVGRGEHPAPRLQPTPWHVLCNPVKTNDDDVSEHYTNCITVPWRCLAQVWHGKVRPNLRESFTTSRVFDYIYQIATGNRIDIGEYIHSRMLDIIQGEANITFCHLIRDMCMEQGLVFTREQLDNRRLFDFPPKGHFLVDGHAQRLRDLGAGTAVQAILNPNPAPGELLMLFPEPAAPPPPAPAQQPQVPLPLPPPVDLAQIQEMLTTLQLGQDAQFQLLQTMQQEQARDRARERRHHLRMWELMQRTGREIHFQNPENTEFPIPDYESPPE